MEYCLAVKKKGEFVAYLLTWTNVQHVLSSKEAELYNMIPFCKNKTKFYMYVSVYIVQGQIFMPWRQYAERPCQATYIGFFEVL